ncbi:hypothetical protein [Mesorhizobium sp. NZP2298]|uniref:hypothetical protein n=1 Tax=Mesorhizobium sp. NZP2298 TaxID=2483403 RepID=UPI001FEFF74F|nr:hypothetical protein [Mesorhizobium sp. NZP2298]
MTTTHATDKPFMFDKRLVYEAYKAVNSSGGAAGVDGQTIEAFEANLERNLYRIWNRMSSESYYPPPVRAVPIPKKTGGQRILGVPTVSDRNADDGLVPLPDRAGGRSRQGCASGEVGRNVN